MYVLVLYVRKPCLQTHGCCGVHEHVVLFIKYNIITIEVWNLFSLLKDRFFFLSVCVVGAYTVCQWPANGRKAEGSLSSL